MRDACIYQEKVIRPGFSAMGSSKWLAATVDMGKMATKSVMRQSWGTKGATARMIMPTINARAKIMENLNYQCLLAKNGRQYEAASKNQNKQR